MIEIFITILPIFGLIALGTFLKWIKIGKDEFWRGADKITYFVFLPALLFHSLATANFSEIPIGDAIFTTIICIIVVAIMVWYVRRAVKMSPKSWTSLMQGSIRGNTYIVIAIMVSLHHEQALPAIAVVVMSFVPLVNLISVLALYWAGQQSKKADKSKGWRDGLSAVVKQVITNPLILATIGGIILGAYGIGFTPPLDQALEILGKAALPMGLIAVGAGLTFTGLRRSHNVMILALLFKLVILPAVLVFGMNNMGVEGPVAIALLLNAAAPAAPSSYILARQLGGDAPLMAAMITLQTLLSMLTIPVWLWAKDFVI